MLNGSSADFATGRWVHAAVVRDTAADELLLYCNGLLVSTAVDYTGDISSPGEDLFIGASPKENAGASGPDSAPVDHFLSGMLDDVRIYDYALSQAELMSVIGAGEMRLPLLSSSDLFNMAGRYEKSRKYEEARSIYQQVVQQYPDSSEAAKAKIDIPKMNILSLFDSKEESAARAALDSLIAGFPEDVYLPEALYEVAKKRYQDSGKYERAQSIYEKITTQWPGSEYDLKSQRNLVISYISMGETSQARQALDKLALEFNEDPGLAGALLSIAEIYRKSKKYEEAKSIYETVVTNYLGTERALKAQKKLAIIYVDVDDDPNARQAIDKLSQDFSGDPNLADALYEIAKRYEWVRGKYEQAAPIYQQIVQNFPDSSYVKEKLDLSRTNIIYLIESGNYNLAAEALTKLLSDFSEHPDLAWTLDGIAGRYEKAKRYDQARSIYQKIVTDYNETDYAFTAQKKLAILEINAGDDAAAQEALDILIADFNDHPDLPEAILYVGHGFYTKARLKEKDGLDVEAKEYYLKAVTVWERVITDLPPSAGTSPEAYYVSAVVYSQELGDYLKGIDYYQQVVDNWPDYTFAWHAQYFVGMYYEKLRNSGGIVDSEANPKIEQAYKSVVEKYPDCKTVPKAALKLGYLNLKRGQRAEAVMYYEIFLATANPNDSRIESVEARLEQLKGEEQ